MLTIVYQWHILDTQRKWDLIIWLFITQKTVVKQVDVGCLWRGERRLADSDLYSHSQLQASSGQSGCKSSVGEESFQRQGKAHQFALNSKVFFCFSSLQCSWFTGCTCYLFLQLSHCQSSKKNFKSQVSVMISCMYSCIIICIFCPYFIFPIVYKRKVKRK